MKKIEQVKAVFFDIDGTYFDSVNGILPQENIDAVNQLKAKGYRVALASARPYNGMVLLPVMEGVKWDGFVCTAGQEVYDQNVQLIHEETHEKETMKEIFRIAEENDIAMYAIGEDAFFTKHNAYMERFREMFHLDIDKVKPYEGEHLQLLTLLNDPAFRYEPYYASLLDKIDIVYTNDINTDIFVKGVSKATGIHHMMRHWGLPEQDYLCFGDTLTDLPMILDACVGVAMENAIEEVKRQADAVCPSCDQSGIPIFLKKAGMID